MKSFKIKISLFISTVCFIGYFPYAGGTVASAAAMAAAFFLPTNSIWHPIWVLGASIASVFFTRTAEDHFGVHDDPRIVIDEFLGYLLAVSLLPHHWGYFAAAFVLFRFFDIVKPWIIDKSQDLPWGLGVMADDLLAAVFTNIILQIFYRGYALFLR